MWISKQENKYRDEIPLVSVYDRKYCPGLTVFMWFANNMKLGNIKWVMAMDPPQDCGHDIIGMNGRIFGDRHDIFGSRYRVAVCRNCKSSWVFYC